MGLRFVGQTRNYNLGIAQAENVSTPDFDGYLVTPADGADLPNGVCDAIYVTGAGNVNVDLYSIKQDASGASTPAPTAVITTVAANTITPTSARRIRATSTTATGIYALYRRG